MDHRQIDALMAGIAPVIRDAVVAAQTPLLERLAALEARAPEKGDPGKDGRDGVDGKDGTPGRDGVDGVSVDQGTVETTIREAIQRAVAALPTPKDGEPGRDGIDGKDADPAEIRRMIDMALVAAVAELPKPVDGKSIGVEDVRPLLEELVRQIPAPKNGRDGVGLAAALIDRDGRLVLTLSDGSTHSLGVVVGRDGDPGMPGRDGQDGKDGGRFEEIEVNFDGERTFSLAFVREGERREFGAFIVPAAIYRGVWRSGAYEQGDAVTFGGSIFIAKRATSAKPETSGDDWQLAVKRGRDGKDAKVSAK